MQENELIAQLQREGFSHTYAWEDGPNTRRAFCAKDLTLSADSHVLLRHVKIHWRLYPHFTAVGLPSRDQCSVQ